MLGPDGAARLLSVCRSQRGRKRDRNGMIRFIIFKYIVEIEWVFLKKDKSELFAGGIDLAMALFLSRPHSRRRTSSVHRLRFLRVRLEASSEQRLEAQERRVKSERMR